MKQSMRGFLAGGKRRVLTRLAKFEELSGEKPILQASQIRFEAGHRARGMVFGGIGPMLMLARKTGLVEEIDARLRLLKVHRPYHESDHVLNIAFNALCGGTCLEDIELRRNDEVFLDALDATCIPDPTTAGDFCRRFKPDDIESLMTAIDEARLRVWKQQPREFFDEAILEADGTLVETCGECKEGMDVSYEGRWGYQTLVVSLANTAEPLRLANRSGNRPSHEGAAARFDQSIELVRRAGFRKVTLRGDTDFSQTAFLDGWHRDGVGFVFGIDAMPNLVKQAEALDPAAWKRLERDPKYTVATEPRAKMPRVKEAVVQERGFRNLHLLEEQVAEFAYQPTKCRRPYRIVVVQKLISVEEGQTVLFAEHRYFFYITNRDNLSARDVVLFANDRCNQEKLIQQLKSGVHALQTPVDTLVSNWAFMVMAALAWSMKAWFALLIPEEGRWRDRRAAEKRELLRMEFKRFLHSVVLVPVQVVRSGRTLVYRLLAWRPWAHVLVRACDALRARPRLC